MKKGSEPHSGGESRLQEGTSVACHKNVKEPVWPE